MRNLQSLQSKMSLVGLLILFVGGIVGGLVLMESTQDIRQQAANDGGIVEIRFLSNQELTPNTPASIKLEATNLDGSGLIGLQAIVNIRFSGGMPQDIQFVPGSIPGMQSAGTSLNNHAAGKQLVVGFLTTDPSQPSVLSGTQVLGTLTFTVPSTGEVFFEFNNTLSRVIQNGTGNNLAKGGNDSTVLIAKVNGSSTNTTNNDPVDNTPVIPNNNVGGGDTVDKLDQKDLSKPDNSDELIANPNSGLKASSTPRTLASARLKSMTASQSATLSAQPTLPSELPQTGSLSIWLVGLLGIGMLIGGITWLKLVKQLFV